MACCCFGLGRVVRVNVPSPDAASVRRMVLRTIVERRLGGNALFIDAEGEGGVRRSPHGRTACEKTRPREKRLTCYPQPDASLIRTALTPPCRRGTV